MTNISDLPRTQHYDQEIQQIFNEIEGLRFRKEVATNPESVELFSP